MKDNNFFNRISSANKLRLRENRQFWELVDIRYSFGLGIPDRLTRIIVAVNSGQSASVQRSSDGQRVEDGSNDGHLKNSKYLYYYAL